MIRHVVATKPVLTRSLGVQKTTAECALVASLRFTFRAPSSCRPATLATIALATIAGAADVHLDAATSAEKTTYGVAWQDRSTNNRRAIDKRAGTMLRLRSTVLGTVEGTAFGENFPVAPRCRARVSPEPFLRKLRR